MWEWAGSIPARAGERVVGEIVQQIRTVHPRACGGEFRGVDRHRVSFGPSPRVRGKGVQ